MPLRSAPNCTSVCAIWGWIPVKEYLGTEQPRRLRRLEERLRHLRIDDADTSDVYDHGGGSVHGDTFEQCFHDLLGALAVDGADQWHDDHLLADR
jgi:hypothetical protein